MTLAAGIDRPVRDQAGARTLAAGVLRFGVELVAGMHVRLGDGRWAVVAGDPTTIDRGRLSVPVRTWPDLVAETVDGIEPECLLVGWGRRVPTRTPEEQRAYVTAVWAAEENEEGQ